MKKNILIVGGLGYIGSHTANFFIENNYDVIVFDNLYRGHEEFLNEKFTYYKGDILNIDDLEKVFRENNICAVVHFAALSEVGESVKNPSIYYLNNIVGTQNLLTIMLKFNVKKIVFSSTAAVYGNPKLTPITEDSIKSPTNPYGNTKLLIEKMLSDYDVAYGLKYVILRYFNAAGAGYGIGEWHEPETHLIPLVINTALGLKDEICVFGNDYDTFDGTCIRDYVHVLDLALAHKLSIEHLFNFKTSNIFNLGSNTGYSVNEIIETTKLISQKNFHVKIESRREGDPAILIADSSKIKKILGWETSYNLTDIISSALVWHKKLSKLQK
jgi:UDP-glucose 4-epimerase